MAVFYTFLDDGCRKQKQENHSNLHIAGRTGAMAAGAVNNQPLSTLEFM